MAEERFVKSFSKPWSKCEGDNCSCKVIHKTNSNHKLRPISRCDISLKDNLIGRSYYWDDVTCKECLRYKKPVYDRLVSAKYRKKRFC